MVSFQLHTANSFYFFVTWISSIYETQFTVLCLKVFFSSRMDKKLLLGIKVIAEMNISRKSAKLARLQEVEGIFGEGHNFKMAHMASNKIVHLMNYVLAQSL